jgi:tetratricopeptide (TPR) repeat protein
MTFFYRAMGDHERAVACGQQALTLSDMLQDMALQTETCLYLGTAYHGLGHYQQALATFAQARATLARHPQQTFVGEVGIPTVLMHAYPIWSLAEVGAFDEGLVLGEEGLRLANTTDSPYSLAMVSCAVGLLHLRQGAFATASAILEQALHLCQTRAVTGWIPGIASHLGYAYALSGRLAESVPLLQQAITASQHISGGHALWITWLGEALLLDRRVEEARAQAQCALALARQRRERGHQAWGLRLLGAIALQGNPADLAQAKIDYQQALELADELMMPPLLAHCHMGLAMVYLHTGRQALASTELTAAIARFRDLGMVYWQLQAEAHQARLA